MFWIVCFFTGVVSVKGRGNSFQKGLWSVLEPGVNATERSKLFGATCMKVKCFIRILMRNQHSQHDTHLGAHGVRSTLLSQL